MSYGSTYIQNAENCSRVTGKITRSRKEYDRRVVRYEKEFDVNLSRINTRERSLRESMVAYSEKMRAIADARQTDPLFVRAKHIPKYPNRPAKKRRPMSFDELLGRDREKRERDERPNAAKQRPLSDKDKPKMDREDIHLPALSSRLKQGNPKVQVSLVSASDLYDIVDFSLRSKGTREDSIQIFRMENEAQASRDKIAAGENLIIQGRYDKYERTTAPPKGSADGGHDNEATLKVVLGPAGEYSPLKDSKDLKLPSIAGSGGGGQDVVYRSRPHRVKRMKLQKTVLSDIPEDKILTPEDLLSLGEGISGKTRIPSPPPARLSPKSSAKLTLSSIQEDADEQQVPTNPYRNVLPAIEDGSSKRTKRILMRDDGDVRIEVTQCPPKQEPLSAKLKAHKRFKKLIFLRDLSR